MTLEIEFSRSHTRPHRGAARTGKRRTVLIGLVNNMPDTALEATEAQFARMLSAAADSLHVRLRFYFLPEVPRGAAGGAAIAAVCDFRIASATAQFGFPTKSSRRRRTSISSIS